MALAPVGCTAIRGSDGEELANGVLEGPPARRDPFAGQETPIKVSSHERNNLILPDATGFGPASPPARSGIACADPAGCGYDPLAFLWYVRAGPVIGNVRGVSNGLEGFSWAERA